MARERLFAVRLCKPEGWPRLGWGSTDGLLVHDDVCIRYTMRASRQVGIGFLFILWIAKKSGGLLQHV